MSVSIALLVAAPTASAGPVLSSHSGWFWGAPAPQAQNLSAVEFAGSTGYASGDFGTLMRSDDSGRTWSGLKTGLSEGLSHLRLLGPMTVIVGGTCALRRSDDGGVTFRRLPWTASDESCSGGIASFDFPSSANGYLVLGNGNLLRSSDGGRTWSRRTAIPDTAVSGVPGISPEDVDFVSDNQGYAATNGGEVFQTVDGGNTWRTVLGLPWTIRSISFPSADVGYVAGEAPAVLKTTDGGVSWEEQELPLDVGALREIRCLSTTVCEGVTHDGDRLVRTTDGGQTWDSVAATTIPLRAVGLPTQDTVVAVGVFGVTVVSTPGGQAFDPIGYVLPGSFDGVAASGGATAYAYGSNGSLARTTNGGATWQEADAPTSDKIRDVSFLNANRGYVLDTSGQLLFTGNGGASFEILDTGALDIPQAVLAVDPKHVLLVGPAGLSWSTDGRTFKANAQTDVRSAPLFDADHSRKTVVAYGPDHIFRSNSSGAAFRRVKRPSGKTRIDVIDVVTPKTWFLLDARGYLFRTNDAARHWQELPGLATELGYGMSFSDENHGWVAVPEFGSESNGWVMHTNNGGHTWEPQLLARTAVTRFGLAAVGKSSGFALIGSNGLFGTHTAGSAGRPSKLTIASPTKKIPVVYEKVRDKKTKKLVFKLTKKGKKIRQSVLVRIHGKLENARGGEKVVVSYREQPSANWLFQEVTVASSGAFTVVARVKYTTMFVAQWAGDDRSRGAGSGPLRISGPPVPKPAKKHR
jgi:photosystem II stability/assembly factor-like uncharacterized protein